MGPLLEHIREWRLDHLPHLALIPLGSLAAIPCAAAWTDSGPAGQRRYAIDDVVLSYAASARLLGETARRPRRRLSDRVVLVTNPDGELPMTRRATRLLASYQYQDAEVYGAGDEANGAATIDALLGALPAGDRPGASLLQLSTHGRTEPAPGLKAKDGWLALARILGQARDRAPDAPGGLVITNACLTDTTRTHYDESLTLATAFLAGGATAVIGTRWPVDDDTVAVLSLRLHYYLQLGRPPAEALRQAQLDLLRPAPGMLATLDPVLAELTDARLSHAASWAGHVHHGI
jgi:CHAT domain-containing protein